MRLKKTRGEITMKHLLLIFIYIFTCPMFTAHALIVDHNCIHIDNIPQEVIQEAKQQFKIAYGHTSHGSQIISGMTVLMGKNDLYSFNHNGSEYSLSLHDYEPAGDLGNPNRTEWAERTRSLLESPDNDRNMIMWSWCGQVSSARDSDIETYLNLMNQLEQDFPSATFVYMTGHLDGTGETGNLHLRNEQIRNYCKTNNKILFDFADIESYDPDGNYYLNRGANDQCNYYDNGSQRNWANEWCESNFGECSNCNCAHSESLNCDMKGKAFWWMLSQLVSGPSCIVPPENLMLDFMTSQQTVFLTWIPLIGENVADRLILQKKIDNTPWNLSYQVLPGDANSYSESINNSGIYQYRLVAHKNNFGDGNSCDSTPSTTVYLSYSDSPPNVPSMLTAQVSGLSVLLNWTDNSNNETAFIIERRINNANYIELAELIMDSDNYLDENLVQGNQYSYRVKAKNEMGQSDYSNTISVTITVSTEPVTIFLKHNVDGYAGFKDTYLDMENPDNAYGETQYKYVQNDPKVNYAVSFEIPEYIKGKSIQSATLKFYCWSVSKWTENSYLDLYLLIQEWDENSANWNHRNSEQEWQVPGGTAATDIIDRVLIPSSSFYPIFDITSILQEWADDQTENFGLLLKNDSSVITGIKGSEYSEYGRPLLEITYATKTGEKTMPGDVNHNGHIDVGDAILLLKSCSDLD